MKKHLGKIINVILIISILLLVFVPDTRSWFMRQLIRTGIYNAKADTKPVAKAAGIHQLALTFRDSKGMVLTEDSLKGKIVFINFWATWCPPCRAEMPSLNNLYKTFKNERDIIFLFVSEDEEPAAAIDYLHASKFEMPMYTASGQAPSSFYAGTLPTTLLFDKTGTLIYKNDGMANYNTSNFVAHLRALQQRQ